MSDELEPDIDPNWLPADWESDTGSITAEDALKDWNERTQPWIHPDEIARAIYLLNRAKIGIFIDLALDDFDEQISDAFHEIRSNIYITGEAKLNELAPELVEKKNELFQIMRKRNLKKKEKKFIVEIQKTIEAYGVDIMKDQMNHTASHAAILFWTIIGSYQLRNIKLNQNSVDAIRNIYPHSNEGENVRALDQAEEVLRGLRFRNILETLQLIHSDEDLNEGQRLRKIMELLEEDNKDDNEEDDDDDDRWLFVPSRNPVPIK